MKTNKQRVKAGKVYKVTFGVNQTRKVNTAANHVNETPQEFLVKSTLDTAESFA